MFLTTLTVPAAERLGYHPYRAPTGANSVPYDGRPACNNCGFCAFYGCPIEAKGDPVALLRRALRTRLVRDPARERRARGAARRRPGSGAGVCATSTPTAHSTRSARAPSSSPAARSRRRGSCLRSEHRQLVRSRRPLPDVPPADDRARVLPVPPARVQGPRRHAPDGRPDHRRRRDRGRRRGRPGCRTCAAASSSTAAAATRSSRRCTPRRARSTARGWLSSDRRDKMVAFTMQGEDLPQADEPRRPRPDRARRVGPPGRAHHLLAPTRTMSRARTTGGRVSSAVHARRRARPTRRGSRRRARRGRMAPDLQPISRHWMGTTRMGDDPRASVCDPVATPLGRRQRA